jgi:aminopeptidase N
MGYRASNTRTGWDITRRLIYPKGAYILHMIRMMMYDRHSGDDLFKETMRDFVKTYRGKPATTEDFKAILEKHMTPDMDLDGDHKMDWFFNEYVYGTQLPACKLDFSFDTAPDGALTLNLKVTQSNVDSNFKMLIPVYVELEDGSIVQLGRVRLIGTTPYEQKVPLGTPKVKPRNAVINYYDDVLCSP